MRTLLIVAAYFILRPWLLKLAGVSAGLNLDKSTQEDEDKSAATEAPNASNGAATVLADSDSENEETQKHSIRKRQQTLQEIMEGKGRSPAEETADSDQEIEKFLRKVIK